MPIEASLNSRPVGARTLAPVFTQRAERTRAKEQKKQEKLQRRQEESERRKAAGLPPEEGDSVDEPDQS